MLRDAFNSKFVIKFVLTTTVDVDSAVSVTAVTSSADVGSS